MLKVQGKVATKTVGIKAQKIESLHRKKVGAKTSKTEKHNREVQKLNCGFTERLKQLEADIVYEDSVQSYENVCSPNGSITQKYVFSSEDDQEENGPKLIVMNIDLGPTRNGVHVLTALDSQKPDLISMEFAQKHRLGPRTQNQLKGLIEKKIQEINKYQGHQYY